MISKICSIKYPTTAYMHFGTILSNICVEKCYAQ